MIINFETRSLCTRDGNTSSLRSSLYPGITILHYPWYYPRPVPRRLRHDPLGGPTENPLNSLSKMTTLEY